MPVNKRNLNYEYGPVLTLVRVFFSMSQCQIKVSKMRNVRFALRFVYNNFIILL